MGCLLKLIYLCFASCISALTRFSFVVHAFTGDSFNNSAKGAYHVLKTCFVNAYVSALLLGILGTPFFTFAHPLTIDE